MLKIYLSGGMKSQEWRQKIRTSIKNAIFFDPSSPGLEKPTEYTAWNLQMMRKADVVFCFLENEASGIGMALEAGFARALNKLVIFVNERASDIEPSSQKFDTIVATADVSFSALEEGIEFLRKLTEAYEQKEEMMSKQKSGKWEAKLPTEIGRYFFFETEEVGVEDSFFDPDNSASIRWFEDLLRGGGLIYSQPMWVPELPVGKTASKK